MSSREPTQPTPEALINAAYDLATLIAEGSQDAEARSLVASSLDDALAAATGQRTQEDIDRLAAELVLVAVGEVDTDSSTPRRLLQQRTAEAWLSHLGDARAQELLDRQRWADAADPVAEPWDGGDSNTNRAIPAPSGPLPPVLGVAYPDVPATPDAAREGLWDNTEHGGEAHAADTDDETTDDPDADVEIVDAEIVEVERVTPGQTRYRMPAGQHYSPANRPGFTRSLTQGRPVVQINTGSDHLDDQR
ncbi:hypothetical protein [Gordonia soli]|uniref:Uncharacterized protein n=1 Tax=Gordonia soli NBRC 108243 TaxID=1223545 RepID=M0QKS7_9ACTN|nr:hypothetical protein [Gordonia soli]GAC68861.1 hypothetical protein GS4_19_00510 [Gordonia soli NBRC 108243]